MATFRSASTSAFDRPDLAPVVRPLTNNNEHQLVRLVVAKGRARLLMGRLPHREFIGSIDVRDNVASGGPATVETCKARVQWGELPEDDVASTLVAMGNPKIAPRRRGAGRSSGPGEPKLACKAGSTTSDRLRPPLPRRGAGSGLVR